nr:uncharacterized protein LOC111416133 [Onthophagus taurus]
MQSNCNQGSVECDIKPHESNHPVLNFTAIISKNICSYQPKTTIDISKYNHLRDLKISPSQTSPNCIDLLLGAELVPHIFTGERRIGDVDEPAAIGSIFGWLLMGKTSENNNTTANISLLVEPSLDQYLQKFWELDQVKNNITEAPEDIRCEEEFVNNYQRMDNGRFMVKLIFKTASPELVFICDIKQLYRQILIDPHQRKYQRIIWRNSPDDALNEYELNTVTYGVSSSPYLALRTVRELALIYAAQFPEASQVLLRDMYVDDVVTGSVSIQDALNLQRQVMKLLSLGGFELAKWASNSPELLTSVNDHQDRVAVSLDNKDDGFVKVLGFHWDPQADAFGFSYTPRDNPCTKRAILSNIARIYDPMGLIAPCIMAAKCLMQKLWVERLDWDDLPSDEIQSYWIQFKHQLPLLSQLKIPRHIHHSATQNVELHLFSDASSLGYCAVAYLRCILPDNTITLNFVSAKSRVAPLKTTSIPRLELCAAVLLADLAKFLLSSFSTVVQPRIFAWCDSMVVLHWINSSPHRWKTFVANRTSHIQDVIPKDCWRHVPSQENPADPGSRGLLPADVVQCNLWWNGPYWLSLASPHWPSQGIITCSDEVVAEEKQQMVAHLTSDTDDCLLTLLDRFSSLRKVKNIVAYILRFVSGCRKKN